MRTVYRLKDRPESMPLPVLAASVAQVRALGVEFSPAAEVLARRWWPGPLTLAFGFDPARERPAWLEGRDEVAVRIPDHEFLRRVLAQTGPLLVTSANPHGAPTPSTAPEVTAALGDAVGLLIDGGELDDVPSTLVNISAGSASVEREGALSAAAIADALREVQ